MKKIVLALFIFGAFAITSSAQDYTHAIGGRISGGSLLGGGITYKNAPGGYEIFGMIYGDDKDGNNGGFSITGLKEQHNALGAEGLYWYWGYGLDLGIRGNDNGFTLGVDGVIGLEWTVLEHLNLTVDAIPRIGLINDLGDFGGGGNLGIRYAW